MNHMNWDNLEYFAFVNTDTLVGKPKGVVMDFHGFSDATMFEKSNEFARYMGKRGILYVFPYYSVWAWMSKASIAYIEEVIDVVWEHYGLDDDTPFVPQGGSMGGMTASMYCIMGKRKPVACAMNCPVSNLERISRSKAIRRSVYSAHILDERPIEKVIDELSPLNNVSKFPKIPYFAVYGSLDEGMNEEVASEFETAMLGAGHDFKRITVEGMGHCNLFEFPDAFKTYLEFIADQILK